MPSCIERPINMKRNSIFLLWIGVVLSIGLVFSEEHSDTDRVLNVGAIFSLGTISGKVSKIAMEAAVSDVNSDPNVLGGRKLSLHVHDSNFSGFLGIMGALQFMKMDTVAILGPQSSRMASVLSHFTNQLHVPLLSFTALDPTLSSIQYPYFIQTAPNDMFQMSAIAELISFYGWSEVTAIYTDDDQSRNGIAVLGSKLADRHCRISYKATLPPDLKTNDENVRAALNQVKMMESRVIVAHTTTMFGPKLLKIAEELEMIKQGYVWIATSWLSTVLDSKSLHRSKMHKSLNGVLTLRLHTPDSDRKREFISRWKSLSNETIALPVTGLYAYDTVWLLAHALRSFFHRGNNASFSDDPILSRVGMGTLNLSALSVFDGGRDLLDMILQTSFVGLTGPHRIVDQDRSLLHTSYDILNVVGDEMKLIGYWSNYSGLSVVLPEALYKKPSNRSIESQRLLDVVWPGGGTEKPRGWVFPNNGRKLRIGVPYRVSFKGFVVEDNRSHVVGGFCIDVFQAAVKLLPYPVPFEFELFGDRHQNPNYNDLINKITTNDFDAVVGDIAIVTERIKKVDFTQPYAESGLVVIAPAKKVYNNAWSYLKPFTPWMWAVTAGFVVLVGVVIWVLEHEINDEFAGSLRTQLLTVLWFSFSTMFFSHRENTLSTLGKMVMFIWLFVVLIIQSSYTASLTSILTVQQLSSPIKGIDSLIASTDPIGFQVGSFAENYMIDELNIPKSRLKALNSPEEYATALQNGTVAAVVDERPYIDLFLQRHCPFVVVGPEFTRAGWGFAFPRDSPLAIDMSTAILRLSEDGTLQNITKAWEARIRTTCTPQDSQGDTEQLQLNSFIGLFLLCGAACVIALSIYFYMIASKYKRHLLEVYNPPIQDSSRAARIQKFLSFVDKKDARLEESQSKIKRKRSSMSADGEMN